MSAQKINEESHIHIGSQELDEDLKENSLQNLSKNNINKNNLERTLFVKKKITTFSLDELGTIAKAKDHQSANRPLKILQNFNGNVNFCHCCDLPCETKDFIVPFNICDSTETFVECGVGISLFFYFFKFIILITALGVCALSIWLMVLNMLNSGDVKDFCNLKYKTENTTKLGNCYGYVTETNEDNNYYKMFNLWIQRFSSDNIFVYVALHQEFNKNDDVYDVLNNYSLMNFLFLITSFILNLIFLFLMRVQIKWLNRNYLTIKDYTVLISNTKKILTSYLDSKNVTKVFNKRKSQIAVENYDDFIKYVNDYLRNYKDLHDIKLEHINLCHNLGDYLDIMKKYEECKNKIFLIDNDPYNVKQNKKYNFVGDNRKYFSFWLKRICCSEKPEPLTKLKQDKIQFENSLKLAEENVTGSFKEVDFTGYMLISFNRIEDKEKFLSYYPEDFFGKISFFFKYINYYIFPCCIDKEEKESFFRSKEISARNPPEPEDIIWENFKYSFWERIHQTITTYLICFFIMAISFGCVFGLTVLQDRLNEDDEEHGDTNIFLKYLISFGITIAVSIINSIIQMVLGKITYREKPISKSNYILSLSIKITIFTFLNSAIIPFITKHIVANYKDDTHEKIIDYVSRKRNNLLIDDMFIYFLVNAIVTPILYVLNVPFLLKKFQICLLERKKDPDKHHHMTQRELNKLYEYPDMDLAFKLSYIAKTLAMCMFYMPIFPLGYVLSLIGFIFDYWVEKYIFTHQCKRPEMLDEIIEQFYVNFFIVILFIGGIGDYVFLHDAFESNTWTLLNIILFGALIIIPYTRFITCDYIDINKSKYGNRPLSEVYFTFYNDYQRQNPLTKREGLKNYLTELKNKDYLSENAFNLAFDNIDKLNLMEIYYGITEKDMQFVHQSVIGEEPKESTINACNFRRSVLGKGALKSTIIRPEIQDNFEQKKMKREFYESQIFNMLGRYYTGSSNMKDEENHSEQGKLRLNEIPLTKSVYDNNNNNNDTNNNINNLQAIQENNNEDEN